MLGVFFFFYFFVIKQHCDNGALPKRNEAFSSAILSLNWYGVVLIKYMTRLHNVLIFIETTLSIGDFIE